MGKEGNVPNLGYFKPEWLKFDGFDYGDRWQKIQLLSALNDLCLDGVLERTDVPLPEYRILPNFTFTEVSDPMGGAVDFQSGQQTPGKLNIVGCSEKPPSTVEVGGKELEVKNGEILDDDPFGVNEPTTSKGNPPPDSTCVACEGQGKEL